MHSPLARIASRTWAGVTLPILLAACQAPPLARAQDSALTQTPGPAPVPTPAGIVLNAVPDCQNGGSAVVAGNLTVRFRGADPRDPQVCLLSWKGRTYRYLAGFWGDGRVGQATPQERDAIRTVLLGPVGATASFDDRRADLWGEVTAEHLANPVLDLPSGPRRTVLVRTVKHDAHGRARVRVEALHWVDARTGIALKRQIVTRMANGEAQVSTTWRVERLTGIAS